MADATCSIDGCERPVDARGWCTMHWKRWRRHGDLDYQRWPSLEERFWAKVDKSGPIPAHRPDLGPCWLWTGGLTKGGYGQFWVRDAGRSVMAHRVAYGLVVAPVPDDLEIDHLCRNAPCVNPFGHLEPVTTAENGRRSNSPYAINARKSHCDHGHEFTPDNTYVWSGRPTSRMCRACAADRSAAARRARKPGGYSVFH